MVLYGKPVADQIYSQIKLTDHPSMAVILVGENLPSITYVKEKEEIAQKLGIEFRFYHLPAMARQKEALALILDLNQNKYISGIIVQLPLPADFETKKILKTISPRKDIDGFSDKFPPPTATAILEILKFYHVSLKDKNIVLVGHGRLVGQPLEKLLKKEGINPIICDSQTTDLKTHTLKADILISATGVPHFIKLEMVKEGAIVIDAGTAEGNGKLVGDVDPKVFKKVRAYTPVPGGVGPVTVACLMRNLLEAAKIH